MSSRFPVALLLLGCLGSSSALGVPAFMSDGTQAPTTPAALAAPIPETMDWATFKTLFGKRYASDDEEEQRRHAFEANLAFIIKHNAEEAEGKHTFRCGVNILTDLTNQEYRQKHLNPAYPKPNPKRVRHLDASAAPATIDWRAQGAVTPVKNQGK